MGRAVVSTTIGAEGLPIKDGHDIVLADDPAPFAAAVVRLLRNVRERRALEQAALRTVEDYAWPVVARELDTALRAAAMTRTHVAPPALRTTITDGANSRG